MKSKFSRKDGVYLKTIDPMMRFFPFIMKKRNESAVYFRQQIDITNLRIWLSEINHLNYEPIPKSQSSEKKPDRSAATFFHVIMSALVQTINERPHLNRFVCGQRIYQRNNISTAFVIKRAFNDEAKEEVVVLNFDANPGLANLSKEIRFAVRNIRKKAMSNEKKRHGIVNLFNYVMNIPRPFIRSAVRFLTWLDYHGWLPISICKLDPMHSSIFISNLGSLQIDAPYHHLYEWGTTSIFLTIGAPSKQAVVTENNQIEVREVINLAFTIDERISDGFYFVKSIKRLQQLLENPNMIEI